MTTIANIHFRATICIAGIMCVIACGDSPQEKPPVLPKATIHAPKPTERAAGGPEFNWRWYSEEQKQAINRLLVRLHGDLMAAQDDDERLRVVTAWAIECVKVLGHPEDDNVAVQEWLRFCVLRPTFAWYILDKLYPNVLKHMHFSGDDLIPFAAQFDDKWDETRRVTISDGDVELHFMITMGRSKVANQVAAKLLGRTFDSTDSFAVWYRSNEQIKWSPEHGRFLPDGKLD